jgi:hypothetical protein
MHAISDSTMMRTRRLTGVTEMKAWQWVGDVSNTTRPHAS